MKNRMMKVAALLLALTLMTSCFVGGTFAKYTSESAGSDTARVALWKFTLEGADMTDEFTFNLFDYTDANVDVNGLNDSDKVIAPGTGGYFQIDLVNNSEVNARYTISFRETNDSNIPLQYSVDGTTWVDSIIELGTTALTNVAIEMGHGAQATIYWRWAFNDTDTAVTDGSAHDGQTNQTDTTLGEAGSATVKITATVTVEQVD